MDMLFIAQHPIIMLNISLPALKLTINIITILENTDDLHLLLGIAGISDLII